MNETVNILEGVDKIIAAIDANKKVILSATVEVSPWNNISDLIPDKDSVVLVSTGMEFVVAYANKLPANTEYWMYIPVLPSNDSILKFPTANVIGGVEEVSSEMSNDEYKVREALKSESSKSKAAKKLGITVSTLNSKIKKYNIV
jgi:transcriptional regulator with GAF, ATPase, and Fis domain